VTVLYWSRFISEKTVVDVVEVATTEVERRLRVTLPPGGSWEISLPRWSLPSVALLAGRSVAVWSGTRLFVMMEGQEPARADFEDEVHAVYSVGSVLCIVAELSVSMYDVQRAVIIDQWRARDVLGRSWWEENILFVESVSGMPLMFKPDTVGVGYVGM
jgi:hypothetical protein